MRRHPPLVHSCQNVVVEAQQVHQLRLGEPGALTQGDVPKRCVHERFAVLHLEPLEEVEDKSAHRRGDRKLDVVK